MLHDEHAQQDKGKKAVKRATTKIELRKRNRPKLVYNTDLPIMARKDEIITAIKKNQVIIIAGETGSGKTTQIPKFCLAAGCGINGQIGCTQPRRIAATSVARRIAEELGVELGGAVGYKIRFRDRISPASYIKVMTDGILLAETQEDPLLARYDTIIVDEAHERSLNIDFVLGILRSLLARRDDLKVIITSATIDTEKFSKAFNRAPVIEVSGRMYPVETRYADKSAAVEAPDEQTYIDRAMQALDDLQRENPFGDILIFMPTEQAIRETVDAVADRGYEGVLVLPLFARLTAAEQKKAFKSIPGRKIIVATNIAETSITIPGIKYVIDTGLARISRYSPRSRTISLPVAPISRSSADQRKGRCGRVANGVCIRLYSEEDYNNRPLFTLPEILRANLAEVILRMMGLRLGKVENFPFIDHPATQNIRDGYDLLLELGAIVRQGKKKKTRGQENYALTRIGKMMAKMPLDPRLSRMLIEAEIEKCIDEILIIASVLSIQDPRERPVEKSVEADTVHAAFMDPQSDFVTYLNIWQKYQAVLQDQKSMSSVRRFCRSHFLSFVRMREWSDIHEQIRAVPKEFRFDKKIRRKQALLRSPALKRDDKTTKFKSRYAAVHRSILSGFLSNIAIKKEKNIFRSTKGREAMIYPGSSLFNRAGEWIVAVEMVETSRLFIRTVANIDNGWLEDLGRSLCRYTYLEPHWERNREEVVATEQVSLFGLIIVSGRRVGYGGIQAEEAGDIFIRDALITGDMRRPLPFMIHNQQMIDSIRDMENRIRRRTLMVEENALFKFYLKRLPKIYDTRTLKKMIKEKGDDDFLRMKKSDLFAQLPEDEELSLYPNSLKIDEREYPYQYKFEPGATDDGVTVEISSFLAADVPAETLDWLVPGLLKEKITALLKSLPKKYRTRLVPINTTAEKIIEEIPRLKTGLATALSRFIYERFGISIPASAWRTERLPEHLKMRIAITGPEGNVIDSGRDSAILRQKRYKDPELDRFEADKKKWERTGITRWDFGDLPDRITLTASDGSCRIFHIALTADSENDHHVNLRLFERAEDAAAVHPDGVAALFSIIFSKELKFLKKVLRLPQGKKTLADYFGGSDELERRLMDRVKKDLFHKNIRKSNDFKTRGEAAATALMEHGRKMHKILLVLLDAYHDTRTTLFKLENSNRDHQNPLTFLAEMREDLARLMPQNFLDLYDEERMVQLDRYIKSISIRALRGCNNPEKDRQRSERLSLYRQRLEALLKELSPLSSPNKRQILEDFFWLLEEYKVSLFAQELKTMVPVSAERLDRMLAEIDRMI